VFVGTTALDFDEDGIYDYLDLDSDNDGIYDLQESGSDALDSDLDGIIDGSNFGLDGLSEDLSLYDVSNIDEDTNFNYIDFDSDGDDCLDVIEAGYTDGDNDGYLGEDSPVSVDGNGLVVNVTSGYTDPIPYYLIDIPLSITQQPAQTTIVCENSTLQVSVVPNSLDTSFPDDLVDSYYWEGSEDGITWVSIFDFAEKMLGAR